MGFDHGDSGVGDYRREGTGFISHHKVEQRLVGDRVRAVIMSKFSVGDVVSPRSRIVPTEDPKVSFDFLVYPFGFSIGLGVIGGGEGKVIF